MNEHHANITEVSLERLKAGDRAEFALMVDLYSVAIYRLAVRMLDDVRDAEDVLQETFIKAYQHIGGFDGRSKLSTWLYRIATNEALMSLRRRKMQTVLIDIPVEDEDGSIQEPLQIVDWTNLPEEELLSSETSAFLNQAIANLPESLRAAFLLREIEHLSTQETAQALEISEGAVKTRLSRARLLLRDALSFYYEERLKGKVYGTS